MIYLDNAATTMTKPPEVVEAVTHALTSFGGVGRGAHPASIEAGLAVYRARSEVAALLGAPNASRVSFTMNATMALNIAVEGLLKDGCAALTTAASHNSVLRPLFRARDERGCEVRVAPVRPDGTLDMDAYQALLPGVSLVVATHASNLTGDVYDVASMAARAHEAGALFVLDVAQTAGAIPLSMADLGVDALCFTGHKSLYGPQGTGGIVLAADVECPALLEGGSGFHSYDERHPTTMPDALEAGTVNAHGLAGLAAGVQYIRQKGQVALAAKTAALVGEFRRRAEKIAGVTVYGGHEYGHCGIVALNIADEDSALVADALAVEYGIATRAGAHCAPLMHRALGTQDRGAVRFSFCSFNTMEDVAQAADAVGALASRYSA